VIFRDYLELVGLLWSAGYSMKVATGVAGKVEISKWPHPVATERSIEIICELFPIIEQVTQERGVDHGNVR
jgi:hypothetical protein